MPDKLIDMTPAVAYLPFAGKPQRRVRPFVPPLSCTYLTSSSVSQFTYSSETKQICPLQRVVIAMGFTQSKMPEPAVGEKLAERLHALEVKESSRELEKGYVYVDEQDRTPYILRHY